MTDCTRCGKKRLQPDAIHTCTPVALSLADDLEWPDCDSTKRLEAAAELRRLHAENEALRQANEAFGARQEWWNERMCQLESDPAYDYCHRLAIMLECMTLNAESNWDAACALLDEYNAARDKWAEAQGQPYVSGFGKD